MAVTKVVIGVDVGGTNTDAVIIDRDAVELTVIAKAKVATTADVTTGVSAAIHLALINSRKENRTVAVQQVNIGTTHFINAVVEGKQLAKVAIIRLCGTASRKVPPFSDFPEKLVDKIKGNVFLASGGYQFDGSEISEVDEDEIVQCIKSMKKLGLNNVVVSGIFSPVRQEQEDEVVEIIEELYPEASVTASHKIGRLGLLERENAAILNECIKPLCLETIRGFRSALDELGLKCPMFLTQNDGTVISEGEALKFPVFTFASGTTNSMRGAAFLSGVKEAIVVDIGGTSTDVGILLKGFPREASSEVRVGGIRTNFRMPDVLSIGLGGGSYVTKYLSTNGQSQVKVGPQSAGYRIEDEALLFSKSAEEIETRVVTATDIAVAAGIVGNRNIGNKDYVRNIEVGLVEEAMNRIRDMVSVCIDQMRFNDHDMPLILVGGGSLLVDVNMKFDGVSKIVTPKNYDVANAVGAALSQISINSDQVVDLEKRIDGLALKLEVYNLLKDKNDDSEKDNVIENVRKVYLQKARENAMEEIIDKAKQDVINSGAVPESVILVDKDDVALSYVPGNATRIKIKLVGDLKVGDSVEDYVVPEAVYNCMLKTGIQERKQTVTNTGTILNEQENTLDIKEPIIDASTGEWLISEYDIECLSIGAGILGCGGGGNPHVGRLLALKALKDEKKIRVVTPSRFLKSVDAENSLVTSIALMGAPLALYEKLVSGNETTGALKCMQDLYSKGGYENGELKHKEGVEILEETGVTFIHNYEQNADDDVMLSMGQKKIVAIMSAEIGGMNCIEPLLVGSELDLPILDCDGMGRAFPELQMFAPFIYGCKHYPATLADDKGRRAVVLHANGPKQLENHFRNVVVSMGCSGGVVLSHFNKDEVLNFTVQHSLSHAWRLGDTIVKARFNNKSPVKSVVQSENGKLLVYGKITDVQRETTGGFNKGKLTMEGIDEFVGKTVTIDFQNEFLLAREVIGETVNILACVPDLITIMDADTAQPIPTEEIRYGIRVAVVAMRVSPIMSSETALKFVGPQAFGYPETVKYTPLGEFVDGGPVAPK